MPPVGQLVAQPREHKWGLRRGDPHVGADRTAKADESSGGDADHGEHRVVQLDRAADDVGRRAERVLPEVMVDNDLRRGDVRAVVGGGEAATQMHRDAQRREVTPGDVVDEQRLGLAIELQRRAAAADGDDVPESRRAGDVAEFLVGEGAKPVGRRDERQVDEAMRLGDRQRPEIDGIQQSEHRRRDANAGGKGQDRQYGVTRMPGEDPDRVGNVPHDSPGMRPQAAYRRVSRRHNAHTTSRCRISGRRPRAAQEDAWKL
jgi:hypothetical protein